MDRLLFLLDKDYIYRLADKGVLLASITSTSIGSVISTLYGVDNMIFIMILATIVGLDWLTGITIAHKDKTYSSDYGIQGIVRTGVIMALPALGVMFDKAFDLPNVFFFMFLGGLVYHNFNSLAANCARLGWDRWIPSSYLERIASEIESKVNRAEERKI